MVRRDVTARYTVPADAFESYDALAVDPTSIHREKDAHRRGIRLLLDGILTTIPDQQVAGEERPPGNETQQL